MLIKNIISPFRPISPRCIATHLDILFIVDNYCVKVWDLSSLSLLYTLFPPLDSNSSILSISLDVSSHTLSAFTSTSFILWSLSSKEIIYYQPFIPSPSYLKKPLFFYSNSHPWFIKYTKTRSFPPTLFFPEVPSSLPLTSSSSFYYPSDFLFSPNDEYLLLQNTSVAHDSNIDIYRISPWSLVLSLKHNRSLICFHLHSLLILQNHTIYQCPLSQPLSLLPLISSLPSGSPLLLFSSLNFLCYLSCFSTFDHYNVSRSINLSLFPLP